MRVKKYPSARRGALKCGTRRIEPRNLKMKKCIVKLEKQSEKLHSPDVNSGECDKIANFEPLGVTKSETKVRSSLLKNTSTLSDKHNILKPFNTVVRLGDVSFTSDDPVLKLSEKESARGTSEKITRSYRKRVRKDIYEFISQSEEDCDPTADVVKKIIKEGRAKLVKRKPGKALRKHKPRYKSISEYVQSLERYRRRNYRKVLMERKSNCQGTWNQKFWDVASPLRNASSTGDSKHERNLDLDEFHDPSNSHVVVDPNHVQKPSEVGSSNKDTEILQNSSSSNIQILEILVLPNKAILQPEESTVEEGKSQEVINSNAAVEYSEEREESPKFDYPAETLSNQEDYILNDEPDYLNLSSIDEPPAAEMNTSFVDVNCTAKTPDPEPINTSLYDKPSSACSIKADGEINLETDEPKNSFTETDSYAIEEKTPAKAPEPKPIRKAFWEIEDPEEETLDKSLIKKTYCRPKQKKPRTHFFILFSDDDEDLKKSDKSTKENSSEYYTRSKIQNWVESTKSATEKNDKLGGKPINKAKKEILKTRNKDNNNGVNLKTQQKESRKNNKIKKQIKAEKYASISSRIRRRGSHQLRPLRL